MLASRTTVGREVPPAVTVVPDPWRERAIGVRLRLRATADGGRKTGIVQGYRASWRRVQPAEGPITMHDALVVTIECGSIQPGEEADATILPLHPEYWDGVTTGSTLEMWEGRRLVGVATVLVRG